MRQEDDVFFDSVTDIIEEDEIFFDTIDDNKFSNSPFPKNHYSPKQSLVVRRSKRVKKDNTRLNKEDWILTIPSKRSKNPLKPIVDIISSEIKYNDMGFHFHIYAAIDNVNEKVNGSIVPVSFVIALH